MNEPDEALKGGLNLVVFCLCARELLDNGQILAEMKAVGLVDLFVALVKPHNCFVPWFENDEQYYIIRFLV